MKSTCKAYITKCNLVTENYEKTSGELKNSTEFFMRGLVVISGNTTACAVLLPTDNGVITTSHGKMEGDIVGDVYLRFLLL